CCCIDGEVIESYCDGLTTLSGRSDCDPTGRSNIGFNVRFREPAVALSLAHLQGRRPFLLPLSAILEGTATLQAEMGACAAAALREGLHRLATFFPVLREGAAQLTAAGPALEGVGAYPVTNASLALEGWPIYVAGDACGKFRGLVAALVSGAYAGEGAANDL